MKDEDIINVLKQYYQHTVILYCFEDEIFFLEQNPGTSLNSYTAINNHTMTAKCIISQGNLRYCSWDRNNKKKTSDDKEEAILEGDICINDFMSEIHRIYKKAEKDISDSDIIILQAFSLALASAVTQGITKKDYDDQKTWLSSRKRHIHYIFIIPTEWEHGIKEKIILPIFKQAGLVNEEDHPCKLLFYTELDTMLERLQEDEQKFELESGRQYILWKLEFVNSDTLSMAYNCFEASDSKANNRRRGESKQYGGTAMRNPVSVYYSKKAYSITYIDAIRKNVWTFLKDKRIVAVFPPADMKEEKVMVVIDILIGAALICYSEKLENIEDLTKLSEVYPFEDLDLSHCDSILGSEELLKSINMFEIHEIMFRDNEAVIEEVLNDIMTTNDGSRSSIKTRRRNILANNDCRKNITRAIELPAKLGENSISHHHWGKKLGINVKTLALAGIAKIELSKLYINWIYCFILKYKNNAKYQTLFASTNLPYRCIYNTRRLTHFAAFKFKNSASFLNTRLPPLLLSLPCSYKKDRVLQDLLQLTKKSNPEYILKNTPIQF